MEALLPSIPLPPSSSSSSLFSSSVFPLKWPMERHSFSLKSSLSGPSSSSSSSSSQHHHEEWRELMDSHPLEILQAECRALDVPLLAPFTIASTRLDCVRNVGIRVQLSDGSVGWGECPTLPPVTAQDQPAALHLTARACKTLAAGGNAFGYGSKGYPPPTCWQTLRRVNQFLPGNDFASVRAGIEMAILDAFARSLGMPLWIFFGGCSDTVTTDITIPICSPSEAAALALEYGTRGFRTLKLKIGGESLQADMEMLEAIREVHPTCQFILDANEGYNPTEALEFLKQLHERSITPVLLEQPVSRDDWEGLGHVTRMAQDLYKVPIAADESCKSLEDAQRIVRGGLAHVINIKLAKLGILGSLEIMQLAQSSGIDLMIGGMVETRIAMGFAGHLAAGQGCFKFVDLDTPLLLAEDPVCGGYQVKGPIYKFSESFGHGAFMLWD